MGHVLDIYWTYVSWVSKQIYFPTLSTLSFNVNWEALIFYMFSHDCLSSRQKWLSNCGCSLLSLSTWKSFMNQPFYILGWIISELIAKNVPGDQFASCKSLSCADQAKTRPPTLTWTKETHLIQWLDSKVIMCNWTLKSSNHP